MALADALGERLARPLTALSAMAQAGRDGRLRWTAPLERGLHHLAPLLNHPDDDGPDLTPVQCAAILPRLQEIADQLQEGSIDPLLQRHLDDARQFVVVLQLCIEKDVDLKDTGAYAERRGTQLPSATPQPAVAPQLLH
ncbi:MULTISPECIES: hypothetical protein [unclassified Streptomyces]|uniref:hypothetical protein n=1 Tax=unclassified Streptomyces TaxID=2593676 RepID=UPI0023670210|nr:MULTISPECIES: hypothetical protein [unclassified Streptomyces]MDF3140600.1 hypothetical protein [Streptomyces sp. T21Q-yed]WDF44410.1 hypothetical protein PBV52_50350 [Streptomyces sp. T12]